MQTNSDRIGQMPQSAPDLEKTIEKFQIDTGDDKIKEFYMAMRRFNPQPKLYVKLHRELRSVECLIASDLSVAFGMRGLFELPEDKATLFLHNIADMGVLGLDATFLQENLVLKDSKQSSLGYHYIFGLRYQGKLLGEHCFTVHLDNDQRVVMLHSIYQKFMKPDPQKTETGLETLPNDPGASIDKSLKSYEELAKTNSIKSAYVTGTVLIPDWSNGAYIPVQEMEVVTQEGNFIWLVDQEGTIRHQYTIHADLSYARVGTIWDNVWYGQLDDDDRKFAATTKRVILRDVESTEGHLKGKYAKIEDEITKKWKLQDINIESDPKTDSSLFDRMQAYYHIDRIQRYFRELGLTILDEYEGLKPLRVVLTDSEHRPTSSYIPSEKTIYIKQIPFHGETPHGTSAADWRRKWTEARDSMIIYHEYVHAVTHTLASLRHQDHKAVKNPRYRDMLQAAAMDEGLADYFACSLAASEGAKIPQIGTLRQYVARDRKVKLKWRSQRELDLKPELLLVYKESIAHLSEQEDKVIYQWGEQWSRFLWNLRSHDKIGAEVADTLIAHSILYLSRWSSFNVGILAILLVDQLIFRGIHREYILAVSALNIQQISKKPLKPLEDKLLSIDSWLEIDFGISGNGSDSEEDAQLNDDNLGFGVDPYIVDEWFFQNNEVTKIRHRINIEQ